MKRKLMILLILVLVFSLILSGCVRKKISEKVAENIIEKIAEEESGKDVDVDIDEGGMTVSGDDGQMQISGGENLDWPDGAPDEIPEFKGDIYSSAVTANGLMVGANNVKLDEFGAYAGMLESAGFELEGSYESTGAAMRNYVLGSTKVSVSYSEEAETITIIAEWE